MPDGTLELLAEPYCVRGINSSGGKKGAVLGGRAMMAIIWVVWMERNMRIFDGARDEEINHLRDNSYLASLSASVSPQFRYSSLYAIALKRKAVGL